MERGYGHEVIEGYIEVWRGKNIRVWRGLEHGGLRAMGMRVWAWGYGHGGMEVMSMGVCGPMGMWVSTRAYG